MRIATHLHQPVDSFSSGSGPARHAAKIYPEHAKPLNGYNGGYSSQVTTGGLSPVPGVLTTLSARPGSGAPTAGKPVTPGQAPAPNAIPEPGTTLSIFA